MLGLAVFTSGSVEKSILYDRFKFLYIPAEIDPLEDFSYAHTPANDHVSVSRWIMNCMSIKEIPEIPGNMIQDFLLPGNHSEGDKTKSLNLLGSYLGLIRLSKYISSERLQLRYNVNNSSRFYQISTIITISLGLITTVLVSLSSTEFGRGQTKAAKSIRVLAIVFPALGTASAAIIAFYNPQAEMNNASHTSANLAQLHNQITLGIAGAKCPKKQDDDGDKALHEKVLQWEKRYEDIETAAETSPSSTAEVGAKMDATAPDGEKGTKR